MLFETYYNLHMFTTDKKVFTVSEWTQQSSDHWDTTNKKETQNLAYVSAQRLSKRNCNFQTFLQDPKY